MREHRNLTQEYVAERLGISARTYRQLEHKDGDAARLLTLQRLIALAEALDVPRRHCLATRPLLIRKKQALSKTRTPICGSVCSRYDRKRKCCWVCWSACRSTGRGGGIKIEGSNRRSQNKQIT
ncbi:MAG: helix-turn-helix domain-containing protein [Saprospiraceae bacterium]